MHDADRPRCSPSAGLTTLKADEGGFGPPLDVARGGAGAARRRRSTRAGLRLGDDVAYALDVAATHFFDAQRQLRACVRGPHAAPRTSSRTTSATSPPSTPSLSVEDALAEDDWEAWAGFTARLGDRFQVVGDDLFTTNIERLERGSPNGAANAVLVKMNQIGTITETLDVVARAKQAGFRTVDLGAVGRDGGSGARRPRRRHAPAARSRSARSTQSERLAKYNQLLRIEQELGDDAVRRGGRAGAGAPACRSVTDYHAGPTRRSRTGARRAWVPSRARPDGRGGRARRARARLPTRSSRASRRSRPPSSAPARGCASSAATASAPTTSPSTSATERGIPVTNVPVYCSDEVAEHVLAHAPLPRPRGLHRYDRAIREGDWSLATGLPTRRIAGSTLGIVGHGPIGQALERSARGARDGGPRPHPQRRNRAPRELSAAALGRRLAARAGHAADRAPGRRGVPAGHEADRAT